MFQFLVNNFTYQPYNGAKKGPLATLQTQAGDDWDLDALLAALLGQAGVPTQYVSGTINVPIATLENWLGVTDADTAGSVLSNADLNPEGFDGSGKPSVTSSRTPGYKLQVTVPGMGLQWVSPRPILEVQELQPRHSQHAVPGAVTTKGPSFANASRAARRILCEPGQQLPRRQ